MFFCLVAAALWGGVFFLESKPGQRWLLSFVNQTGIGEIRLEKLDISLVRGRVRAAGIRLLGPDGKETARAGSLDLEISWHRLLTGELLVPSIVLDRPEAELIIDEQGRLNIFKGVSSGPQNREGDAGFPLNIIIDHLEVRDSELGIATGTADIRVGGLDFHLRDFNLESLAATLEAGFERCVVTAIKASSDPLEIELNSARANARLTRETLSNIVIRIGAGETRLAVTGEVSHLFSDPFMDLALDARGNTTLVGDFLPETRPYLSGGALRLSIEAKGALESPRISLRLESRGESAMTASLDGAMTEHRVDIKNFILTSVPKPGDTGGFRIKGSGTLDRDTMTLDTRLGLDINDLALISKKFEFPGLDLAGAVSGDIQIRGKTIRPDIRGEFRVKDLMVGRTMLGTGRAGWRLDRNLVFLDQLDFASGNSRIRARGQAGVLNEDLTWSANPSLDFILEGENFALDQLTPQGRGSLDFKVGLTGTPVDLTAGVSLSCRGIWVKEMTIGDLELEGKLENGVFNIDRARMMNENSRLVLDGSARVFQPKSLDPVENPEFDLHLSQGSIRVSDFWDHSQGQVKLAGRIRGTPDEMTGRLSLSAGKLNLGGQALAGGEAYVRLDGKTLYIDRAEVISPSGARLAGKGRIRSDDRQMDLEVRARDLNLRDFSQARDMGIDGGFLSVDLGITGNIDSPLARGSLSIRDLAIHGRPSPLVRLDMDLKNKILAVQGRLGQETVSGTGFKGRYHIGTREFSTHLDLAGVDLAPWFSMAGQPEFSGWVTGRINARGRAGFWKETSGDADISGIELKWQNHLFLKTENAEIEFDSGRLSLGQLPIALGGEGQLLLSGQGNLLGGEDTGGLNFKARGKIPLTVLVPLVEGIDSATGMIELAGNVNGTVAAPDISADIHLHDLSMGTEWIEQEIRGIRGRIRIDPGFINLEGIKGRLDTGNFSLNGRIKMDRFRPGKMDIELQGQNLGFDIPDLMDIEVNGNLTLAGTNTAATLKGDILLLQGRYYKDVDINLASALTSPGRRAPFREESKAPGFFNKIALDINLARREPLLVENNLAEFSLSPDLTIKGTAMAPLLQGRARVDQGVLKFQKTEFDIKKGVVDFTSPYRTEAEVDLEGEMAVRDWIITLTVTGPLDNLALDFKSDPEEQHADILSLIAFGKTTRELGSDEGGAAFSPEEFLAAMLAEALQKEVKEAAGLDYFEIQAEKEMSNGQEDRHVKVTMGADLSRQITVKYGMEMRKGATVHRMTTSYKLLESLLLNAYQETGGQFGGEVRYKLEFR